MKSKLYKSFVLAIMMVSVTAGLAAAVKSDRSALENVPRFLDEIEEAGFSSQEGSFTFFDLIKQVCTGGEMFPIFSRSVRLNHLNDIQIGEYQ